MPQKRENCTKKDGFFSIYAWMVTFLPHIPLKKIIAPIPRPPIKPGFDSIGCVAYIAPSNAFRVTAIARRRAVQHHQIMGGNIIATVGTAAETVINSCICPCTISGRKESRQRTEKESLDHLFPAIFLNILSIRRWSHKYTSADVRACFPVRKNKMSMFRR